MKHLTCLLSLLLAAPALAQTSVPEISFDAPADYFSYPSEMNLGEITGVAVNSKGHVFMVSRSNATGNVYGGLATQLLEFDERGKFVREIGKGLYGFAYGHAVRVDPQDNIWVVDKGTNMVIKFNPAGRVVMVLGRREEATDEHVYVKKAQAKQVDGMFNEPTDVAWDRAGNIYISDGYVNARVAKYDKDGAWVKSWGSKGTGPGQFNIPHSIAIDLQDNVYVGDRTNHRIQVFDTDGNFKRMFSIDVPPDLTSRPVNGPMLTGERLKQAIGAPNSLCITPGPTQVLFVGESTFPGRIFMVALDGTVLGVIGRSGRNIGQFSGAHALACPTEREIYVAETSNWRVQKLLLR